MKASKDTIFYLIESTIKSYRRFAQMGLQQIRPDMTIDQGLVLSNLIKNPNATQKELSELIFKDMASISRMLDALEKKQFITREVNPNERRRFLVKVTKTGLEVNQAMIPKVVENRKQALTGVTTADIKTLTKILTKISNNVSK